MKINESGRSMIEMLGVLAIIGILSVGGLAGYAKAMGKYKVNKTIDQITQIVTNTRSMFSGHKNYAALKATSEGMNTTLIQKGHLVPEEMITYDSDGNLSEINSAYGYPISLHCSGKRSVNEGNDSDNKAFVIQYQGIPEEACIELTTQDWGAGKTSGLLGICVNGTSTTNIDGVLIGESGSCTGSSGECCVVSRALSLGEATLACQDTNTIDWKFY